MRANYNAMQVKFLGQNYPKLLDTYLHLWEIDSITEKETVFAPVCVRHAQAGQKVLFSLSAILPIWGGDKRVAMDATDAKKG